VGKTYGSERGSPLTVRRAGPVCLTLALLAVALAIPAVAQAYRAATRAEQSEMERSAVLYHANPNSDVPGTNVTVTNVKVSTAGPWALASVAVTAKATGEQAGGPEAFRRIHGTWTDVGFANEEPASMLPKAVAKDLGVPYLPNNESGASPSTSGNTHALRTGFEIAALAGWLLCIISLVSVGRHPTADFQRIGRSRPRWALISLLGIIPYVGIFTSVAYFFKVSIRLPDKVRVPGPVPPPRAPRVPQGKPRGAPAGSKIECPKCYGKGWSICPVCSGMFSRVNDCSCRGGHVDCGYCHGEGKVPASWGPR
jgi:hypothetical protein